ncbi:hypothetical protein ACFX13_012336 [Malus domestica]
MDPRCYTQTPLIILFFFIFGFITPAKAVCKPRDLKLRYLTCRLPCLLVSHSRVKSSLHRGQQAPHQPVVLLRPPAPTPSPNPPSQPPQASPPAGNSFSPSSSSSFLRRSSVSPRGNLFAQPFVLNTASSSTPPNPAIQELCKNTDYLDLCILSLTPFQPPKVDPVSALGMAIKVCTAHAQMSLAAASKLLTTPNTARGTIAALSDCKDMYSNGRPSERH